MKYILVPFDYSNIHFDHFSKRVSTLYTNTFIFIYLTSGYFARVFFVKKKENVRFWLISKFIFTQSIAASLKGQGAKT